MSHNTADRDFTKSLKNPKECQAHFPHVSGSYSPSTTYINGRKSFASLCTSTASTKTSRELPLLLNVTLQDRDLTKSPKKSKECQAHFPHVSGSYSPSTNYSNGQKSFTHRFVCLLPPRKHLGSYPLTYHDTRDSCCFQQAITL